MSTVSVQIVIIFLKAECHIKFELTVTSVVQNRVDCKNPFKLINRSTSRY